MHEIKTTGLSLTHPVSVFPVCSHQPSHTHTHTHAWALIFPHIHVIFLVPIILFMCICVHMHVCMYGGACVWIGAQAQIACMCRGLTLLLVIFLDHYPNLSFKARSLNQTQSLLIQLVWLVNLAPGIPWLCFPGWNYKQAASPVQTLCGFWGSKLHSSCLHKWFNHWFTSLDLLETILCSKCLLGIHLSKFDLRFLVPKSRFCVYYEMSTWIFDPFWVTTILTCLL